MSNASDAEPLRRTLGRWAAGLLAAVATAAPLHAQEEGESGLPLWEVTEGEATVYLVGSVHMLRPEVYPLPTPMVDAFHAAERVAFELDFQELDRAGPMMLQRGSYEAGRSLTDDIPQDLYAELQDQLREHGLPPAAFANMKPWMAALTLSALVIQQGGYAVDAGLDMHFYEKALEEGVEIVALETVDEQIRVFDELGREAQVAYLRSTVEEIDDMVEQMDELTELWQSGDAEGLGEALTESLGDHPELERRILHQRNEAWLPTIRGFLEEPGASMVVVGAGHLVGEGSVVELLRREGHRVEQVTAQAPVTGTP